MKNVNRSGLTISLLIAILVLCIACKHNSQSKTSSSSETDSLKVKHYDPDPLDSLFGNVSLNCTTKFQVDKLEKLGKIWGFLKYYHPVVATGKYDWDLELAKILPKVDLCTSADEFNILLLNWLDLLGAVKKSVADSPQLTDFSEISLKPDFAWVYSSSILHTKIKKELQNVYKNRNRGKNYYFTIEKAGNPQFTHEVDHDSRTYPIQIIRLLSLYRYWNYVAYFFPYRDLIGERWDQVLPEFIPEMINAKDAVTYNLTCRKLISRIHDTHADIYGTNEVLDGEWGKYYPPFRSAIVEQKLVVTGYYRDTLNVRELVRVGDVIESIGGRAVSDMLNERLPDYPASNESAKLREMPLSLLRNHGSPFELQIKRGSEIRIVRVPACNRKTLFNQWTDSSSNGQCYQLLPDNVGYISANKYRIDEEKYLEKAFAGTNGLIVDLRGYPHEPMVDYLMTWLKPMASNFAIAATVDSTTPGLFRYKDYIQCGGQYTATYSKPVVVLVNSETQSQAEFSVMSLQSRDKVKVVGSQTAGADGNITWFHLPGRILTNFSAIGINYPDKGQTQRKGVRIDTTITPTLAGIRDGKDEVLDEGLRVLRQMAEEPVVMAFKQLRKNERNPPAVD